MTKQKKTFELSIYGDNILECERMFELIVEGFHNVELIEIDLSHIYSPKKTIITDSVKVSVQFYPDYKGNTRWHKKGLLSVLLENGANLTEAPDVILTKSNSKNEVIILAIEFSSALPAGNQAWQRSGRALSFSEVNIPYLYITDIGLEELDSARQSISVRSSNPLVPLSYIKNTQRSKNFTLSVLNPSRLLKIDKSIEGFIVAKEVVEIINGLIFETDISKHNDDLIAKTANYLDNYTNLPENVDFKKWINCKDENVEKLILSFKLPKYNKKIAIKTPMKVEMKKLIKDIIPETAISIFNNIPICFIPTSQKKLFSKRLKEECYNNLSPQVHSWLEKETPMIVCLINGFKPGGDDARPDRGLVPLARMLFGFEIDLLSIVFGQAPKVMGVIFKKDPNILAEKNGLWKSILNYSSLTIADSFHWNLKKNEVAHFTRKSSLKFNFDKICLEKPNRIPIRFNENDIDTAIHMTFLANKNVFVSLCNPPGGDWSGISLLDDVNTEHRWMSLPRLSTNAKRPDHIFQIKSQDETFLLIIESKENLRGLLKEKTDLGKGLLKYVDDLIQYASSSVKDKNKLWIRNNIRSKFAQNHKDVYSAAAFLYSSENELVEAQKNIEVDLIIGFDVHKKILTSKPTNAKGKELNSLLTMIGIKLY